MSLLVGFGLLELTTYGAIVAALTYQTVPFIVMAVSLTVSTILIWTALGGLASNALGLIKRLRTNTKVS